MFRLPEAIGAHLRAAGTLLVPAQARVRAIQLAYAAHALQGGAQVWASPDVLTPESWLRREYVRRAESDPDTALRVLTRAQEWLLWRDAVRECAPGAFLDEGALGESLARAVQTAVLHRLALPGGPPGSEAALLTRARALLEARCRELGALPAHALAAALPGAPAHAPAVRLAGFGHVPPLLAGLTASESSLPRAPAAALALHRAEEPAAELAAIAAWCARHLRARADARLHVILPGQAGARTRLAALITQELDPGASLRGARAWAATEDALPLAASPLGAQALSSLALLGGATLELETLCAWLNATAWLQPAAVARAALGRWLRERGLPGADLKTLLGELQLLPKALRAAAQALDGALKRAAAKLGSVSASPQRWAERVADALAALGWPGEGAAPVELQARQAVHELLEDFAGLSLTRPLLGRDEALALLLARAQRTPFRVPAGDVPVSISGTLADPVLEYDGLWVAGLSADVLPQPLAPDPFLPAAAQRAAGIPAASPAGRQAEALRLLAAFRAAGREVAVSYAARAGDLELLPSPLLAGLTVHSTLQGSGGLALALRRPGLTETLADESGVPFNPLTPLPQGTRAVTLQSACPFRAYAELRLGLPAPQAAEPGVPADQRGRLLHTALELLWRRLKDSATLATVGEGVLESWIAESVLLAAQTLQGESPRRRRGRRASEGQFDLFTQLTPALEREVRRAQALLLRLCALERTRAPFTVEATEAPMELTLGGGRLRMRLDRIDRTAHGTVILDYKSGRHLSADWFGERPTHPQLLAYLAAVGAQVVALATVHVTAREVRFSGVAAAEGVLPKVRALSAAPEASGPWPAQQARWRGLIAQLIAAFLAGDARVDPAPGACEYCHLPALCRIGAHRADERGSEDTDE